jgi:hypothetical protein
MLAVRIAKSTQRGCTVQHATAATVGTYSTVWLPLLARSEQYHGLDVQAFEQGRGNFSQASSCGICGEQSNTSTSFSSIFGTETRK